MYALKEDIPDLEDYVTQSWIESNYLSLTGGTVAAAKEAPLEIKNNGGVGAYIKFSSMIGASNHLGIDALGNPSYKNGSGTSYKLLHTGSVNGTLTGSLVPDTDVEYNLGSGDMRMGVVFATRGVFSSGITINNESVATQAWVGNNYLSLTGGTLSGTGESILEIKRTNGTSAFIKFTTVRGNNGYLGFNSGGKPTYLTYDGTANELYHKGNLDISNYLPLSGGTITGTLAVNSEYNFAITNNTTGAWSGVRFRMSGEDKGYIGVDSTGKPIYVLSDQSTMYTLIHSGNVWDYALKKSTNINFETDINVAGYGATSKGWKYNGSAFILGYDQNYKIALQSDYADKKQIIVVNQHTPNDGWLGWKTIAFTDSNVASATKLETARTIWGQSFDGTGNVSGNLSLGTAAIGRSFTETWTDANGDTHPWYGLDFTHVSKGVTLSSYFGLTFKVGSGAMLINSSGNVGIGTTDPQYKLDVNGSFNATSGSIGGNTSD